MVFELYGLNYQIDLKLVCNVLSTASNSSTEKIISNIHHLCETYKWTLSDVPLLLNCKFKNYLMVGNSHRSQHNAKGNMFWYFSAPFISPFLHPNLAIRLISSWNQHFLECNLHRTVEHFISSQPHPTIWKAKDASITTNTIATWINNKHWKTEAIFFTNLYLGSFWCKNHHGPALHPNLWSKISKHHNWLNANCFIKASDNLITSYHHR